MPKTEPVIRPGDIVRVIKPMVLDRVGYDVNYRDVYNSMLEVDKDDEGRDLKMIYGTHEDPVLKDKELAKLIQDFSDAVDRRTATKENAFSKYIAIPIGLPELDLRVTKTVLQYLARQVVKKEMDKDGQLRKKYEHEVPGIKDSFMQVVGRRIALTGKRYKPSGGYDFYSGDYDYEPGGLTDTKTHILYKIRRQIMPRYYMCPTWDKYKGERHDYEIDKEYLEYVCPVDDFGSKKGTP